MIDTGRHSSRSWVRALPLGLVGLTTAALFGRYSVDYPGQAVAVGGGLMAGAVMVALADRRTSGARSYRWVPPAWVVLLLITDLNLDPQDPLAVAAGQVTIYHVIEVLAYATVVALVVRTRGGILGFHAQAVPKGLLLLWPTAAVASTLWSLTPTFTLVRSLQLVVLCVFTLLMVRIWVTDHAAGELLWAQTLRLFVQVVTILAVIGLLVRPWPGDRFVWPAVDPGVAATYVACALLILVGGGRTFTRFRPAAYWLRIGLFSLCLTLGPTRSVLAGVVIGVGAAFWFRGREKPIARHLGMTYYVAGLVLVVAAASQVATYLARGESGESLASLSGRIPLWEFALDQFQSLPDWLGGFGYGTAKVLLYPTVPWAGTAHSTWIELLLGIGVIGLALFAADFLLLVVKTIRSRPFGLPNVVALSILAFLFVVSPISETLVVPGIGFAILAFIHVPALAQDGRSESQAREERVDDGLARLP